MRLVKIEVFKVNHPSRTTVRSRTPSRVTNTGKCGENFAPQVQKYDTPVLEALQWEREKSHSCLMNRCSEKLWTERDGWTEPCKVPEVFKRKTMWIGLRDSLH